MNSENPDQLVEESTPIIPHIAIFYLFFSVILFVYNDNHYVEAPVLDLSINNGIVSSQVFVYN